MALDPDKTIARLTEAVETAYNRPGRLFWRGLLWGLGRGIGSLIGLLLTLAVLIYLAQITGIAAQFNNLMNSLGKITDTLSGLPKR